MFINHYAYQTNHGHTRNVDAFNGKHTFTLTVWMFEGKPMTKLTQKVYRHGCPQERAVPRSARYDRIVAALMPLLPETANG